MVALSSIAQDRVQKEDSQFRNLERLEKEHEKNVLK